MSAHFSTRPTSYNPHLAMTAARVVAVTVDGIGGIVDRLVEWQDRRRQRRELLALDEHLLKDIGVSRVEAEFEGYKPFWRA
jgi:uncharacterized protein YjiS (DUF1127 family)